MKFNTMISAVLQKNQSQTWKCYQQHKYMNRSDEDINVQFASLNLTTSLSVSSDLYRIKEKSHFLVDVIILFCFFVPACAKSVCSGGFSQVSPPWRSHQLRPATTSTLSSASLPLTSRRTNTKRRRSTSSVLPA